jgi:hypothetical protein
LKHSLRVVVAIEFVVLVLIEDPQHQEEGPDCEETEDVTCTDADLSVGDPHAAERQGGKVENEEENGVRKRKTFVGPSTKSKQHRGLSFQACFVC